MTGPAALQVLPVDGLGEVRAGDHLARLLVGAVPLEDGDVLVVTSKVVSKAEGRVVAGLRDDALAAETDRVVARRGRTAIVRTHHGLVMAAAGIDASNVEAGHAVLLPRDPDASARALRVAIAALTGRNVAVVVTDTAGRAWRHGQTDIAVGVAGMDPLHDYAGRSDDHGNELAVTAPAVADELAGAADLVKGKLARRPAAVVRGLAPLVLPPGQHGPGAAALVRAESEDMFGLGAREAVLEALRGEDHRGFGSPAAPEEVRSALATAGGAACDVRLDGAGTGGADAVTVRVTGTERERGAAGARVRTAAHALGWRAESTVEETSDLVRFRRAGPCGR